MALHLPTFFTRTGSAIVFAIIMMAGLLWNEWAFCLLIALIQLLCLTEYFRLMPKIFPGIIQPTWIQTLTYVFSFLLLAVLSYNLFSGDSKDDFWPALLFIPAAILLFGVLSKKPAFQAVLQACGALFYITLPMLLLIGLRETSIIIPIALVLMIWTNDTMAYIVGSFIGKTPFSKISPKKTWEGTIGGAVLTVVGAAIWGYYTHHYRLVDWVALSVIVSIAGTAGDLFESKLKRMAEVKDSGKIMPGHGGALDRFDSLLIATPFVFAYAHLFMPDLPLVIF